MNTTVQITTPLPLYTRDSFASSSSSFDKPETDLHAFGYTFAPSTESRHDRRLSTSSLAPEALPPTYSESHRDVVPEYTATYEPVTLAMYLFRFGFCTSFTPLFNQPLKLIAEFSVPAILAYGRIHSLHTPPRPSHFPSR